MPEGHTLHRLARDLQREFAGRSVEVSSPQGRFLAASTLDGGVFERAYAIGKHLFIEVSGSRLHIHLGLFGKMKKQRAGAPPRASVRLRLGTDGATWDLTGPTACELVDEEAHARMQARLGADPLAPGARPAATWRRVHASRRAIGALLLDQSIVSGIGNVYRAELLFLVGLDPETPGTEVPKATFDALWRLARELLRRGVEANRIVTVPLAERRDAPRSRREQLYVYGRATCRRCGTDVVRTTLAARTMYACPTCQTRPAEPEADVSVPRATSARSRARRVERS